MKKKERPKSVSIPVRLDADLADEVKAVAAQFNEPDSAIIRWAVKVGLPQVRAGLSAMFNSPKPAPPGKASAHAPYPFTRGTEAVPMNEAPKTKP